MGAIRRPTIVELPVLRGGAEYSGLSWLSSSVVERVRLSVAAPCYNEADGIEAVVREWDAVLSAQSGSTEIVLCNDGSTDGTGDVLKRLQADFPRLRVVENAVNGGYGRALSCAIAAARGEYVATIDSDGQFELADAFELLEVLERGGYGAVTGWRKGKKDSVLRVLADRCMNLLVRALFGVRLRDTNCALKVIRGDLLRALRIEARGYPTPTEICVRLVSLGCRIGEQGVTHRERTAGMSKLHPLRTAWGFWRFLLYLRRKLKLHRAGIIVEP
jgi:glycosyltransferase involved in cell wall biosynthesis